MIQRWRIFLIGILLGLVILHELGHFVVAKLAGVRVEEFGVGMPPRIAGIRFGETLYSINWLPLGGFVRLTGEESARVLVDSVNQHSAAERAAKPEPVAFTSVPPSEGPFDGATCATDAAAWYSHSTPSSP